ncbi:MAG: hypothetical protein LBS61_04175, partial [Endomicrobium sp.]|nr:hypothetical protein [Endomicrobium sp.]
SKENVGTEFIITFAKTQSPKWFADKIEIKKGDTVVILDDDPLMYKIWKEKLKKYDKEITLKFFKKGLEALKYLKSLENKEKAFLIADYELQQDINGIDVIEGAGMKDRHALVISAYLSDIKDFSKKSEYLKMFHKSDIVNIPVELIDGKL